MSKLVPTQITDRNGKRTTVHKKTAAAPATRSAIPAPSPPGPVPQGTPLELPEPMDEFERARYIMDNPMLNISSSAASTQEALRWVDGAALAAAKSMIERGSLDAGTVKLLLSRPAPSFSPFHLNRLLIAERLEKTIGKGITDDSTRNRYLHTIRGAADGLARNHPSGRKILDAFTTEEELSGCSAVAEFMLYPDFPDAHSSTASLPDGDGGFWQGSYIRNRHLDRLIRERPEDVQTIISYVKERGMHHANKGPVTALRSYLDETAAASSVGEGWL